LKIENPFALNLFSDMRSFDALFKKQVLGDAVVAAKINTMLYCPKCQQNYEEGVQRFCPNDNERLQPAPASGKSSNQTGGVFTSVLNRKTDEQPEKFLSVPRFKQSEPTFTRLNFRPPPSKIFKTEPEFELELKLEPPIKTKSPFTEPPPNLKSRESVEENQPLIERNETKLADTPIFDSNAPEDFIGQTVNNRFRIVEQIDADENSTAYLAEESGEKFIVRVLKSDDAGGSFADKIYAEERNSLTQLNHLNIPRVFDSGELAGGAPYLVTEYIEGQTVKDYLHKSGQFNALRTARIVRQTADALGAAHRHGILHRGLRPENIVLTVDENGLERIKLTGFGAAKEKLNESNLLYKSPEQVEGKVANFTSDSYSLAVIAYQMLTNRLPFNATSVGDLLKAQREGVKLLASDLRDDLPASVDDILKRALSFNPFDRFDKVQDFGDEFFGEIIANATLETDDQEIVHNEVKNEKSEAVPTVIKKEPRKIAPVIDEEYVPTIRESQLSNSGVKATQDLAWEKRSPEPSNKPNPRRNLVSIFGMAALLAVLFGVWYYFINRPSETFVPTTVETVDQSVPTAENSPINVPNVNVAPTPEEIEAPPLPRTIKQPPDTVYFQNSKENLKGDLLKNFLGFSLYYPKDWKQNEAPKNFLDISKNANSGLPVEQMLITYYRSKGTFKADAEIFPEQVKETNQSLKKILPNYRMISEGKKTVNNGWQAYEVKFQGTGKAANGENITIWGRRLFIPTAIRGVKNGYVVTMLATSLSKDVKNADDVGVKGDLSSILETFEPNQNF
jgi:serine/threonine protein kinase